MSTPDYVPATAGGRIKAGRNALRLSQREFGVLLGYGHGYISDIESDRSPASTKFLQRVASRTRLSLAWLETGEGDQMRERETVAGGTKSRVAESLEEYKLYMFRQDLFPATMLEPPVDARETTGERGPIFRPAVDKLLFSQPETADSAGQDFVRVRRYAKSAFIEDPELVDLPSWMIGEFRRAAHELAVIDTAAGWSLIDLAFGSVESGVLYVIRIIDELMIRELQRLPGGAFAASVPDSGRLGFEFNPNDSKEDTEIFGRVIGTYAVQI